MPRRPIYRSDLAITNVIDKAIHEQVAKASDQDKIWTRVLEDKIKEAGIRLSDNERASVRRAAPEMLRSQDLSPLSEIIRRKRHVHIAIGLEDVQRVGQRVVDAVEKATEATVLKMSQTLEKATAKWAEAEVAYTAGIRTGFEERLARTWKKPFFHYSRYLRMGSYINLLVTARFNEERLLDKSRLATALLLLHVRALAVAGEVDALMRSGYADGAAARWRTLHEISVASAFLVQHGEEVAESYLDHWPYEQLKGARSYMKHRQALGEEVVDKEVLEEIEAQVERLRGKYGDGYLQDNGWAWRVLKKKPKQRITFAEIEEAVNLSLLRPYYRSASEQVHASARGSFWRNGLIEQDPSAAFMLAGPSNYGFADAGINSAKSLLITTTCLIQISPTADTGIYGIILERWYWTLADSFIKAQQGIERREERLAGTPRAMNPEAAASDVANSDGVDEEQKPKDGEPL